MAITLLQFSQQTQVPMRKGIVQQITNESVFLKRLNFIQVDGFAYKYNRQTTLGGIAFRGLNDSYTNDTGVVNPETETLSIFGGEVRTDRQIVNKQGDVARSNAIAAKVKKAGLFFDRYVIKGDPASDPNQFYGLNGRISGNQLLTMGTGPLTLAKLDELIDSVVGTSGKILVMNKAMRRKVTALIRAAAGGLLTADIGPQVTEYNNVPIEVLDEDGDESAILDFTEASSTTSIYCIRLGTSADEEYCQGLIGAQMIEHVAVGLLGTYWSDIVEANMGIALFHPRAAARLKLITNA